MAYRRYPRCNGVLETQRQYLQSGCTFSGTAYLRWQQPTLKLARAPGHSAFCAAIATITSASSMLRSSQRLVTRLLRLPARSRAIASYSEQYRRSLDKPEEFWAEAARDIEWFKPWSKVLDTYAPPQE